ncbi:MAG: sulfur carrier protein ThiS [Thiogranum sp.]|nr:sulfur carrier protein ThiS [Thiogranum sp.]
MELVINGTTEQLPDGINAAQLIEHLGLTGARLAMEVNREIVPRSHFDDYRFNAGDRIEIVRAIGGGCKTKAAASRPQ